MTSIKIWSIITSATFFRLFIKNFYETPAFFTFIVIAVNPTKIVFEADKFMNKLQTYSQALNENLKKDLKSQMAEEIIFKISSKKATLNSDTLNK